MFDSRTFRTAAKEINALSPDVVVVTGDLTEDGIRSQFQQAEQELKRLKAKDVIYVSGNHDYRATRYLLFQQLFPFHQITEIEDTAIIVLSSARPDRDDGEVGHRQNLWRARQALHLIEMDCPSSRILHLTRHTPSISGPKVSFCTLSQCSP